MALRSQLQARTYVYPLKVFACLLQDPAVLASSVARPDAAVAPPKRQTGVKVPPKPATGAAPVTRKGNLTGLVGTCKTVVVLSDASA